MKRGRMEQAREEISKRSDIFCLFYLPAPVIRALAIIAAHLVYTGAIVEARDTCAVIDHVLGAQVATKGWRTGAEEVDTSNSGGS